MASWWEDPKSVSLSGVVGGVGDVLGKLGGGWSPERSRMGVVHAPGDSGDDPIRDAVGAAIGKGRGAYNPDRAMMGESIIPQTVEKTKLGHPGGLFGPPEAFRAKGNPENVAKIVAQDEQKEANKANKAAEKKAIPKAVKYIMAQNPDLDRHQARDLLRQYRQEQANPGLSQFIQSKTNKVDPSTMQMFFQQTVAPYMKQVNDQYNAGALAGTAAMQQTLAGAGSSPAIDVLRSYVPIHQAGTQQMGAALHGATISAPYYDQMLSQLQENISQQQRTQYYLQQQPTAGAAGDVDPGMASLVAGLIGGGGTAQG